MRFRPGLAPRRVGGQKFMLWEEGENGNRDVVPTTRASDNTLLEMTSKSLVSRRYYEAKGHLLSVALQQGLVRFGGLIRMEATYRNLQWHIRPSQLTRSVRHGVLDQLDCQLAQKDSEVGDENAN